jgi:hypothetical protein
VPTGIRSGSPVDETRAEFVSGWAFWLGDQIEALGSSGIFPSPGSKMGAEDWEKPSNLV